MALRATPTIAVCLAAGAAAGLALARPADSVPAASANPPAAGAGLDAEAQPNVSTSSTGAITIEGFDFSGTAAAAPGSEIVVTNRDGAAHTLTASDGAFDTGSLGQDATASIVMPTTPGTYEYICSIHPSMSAAITVG